MKHAGVLVLNPPLTAFFRLKHTMTKKHMAIYEGGRMNIAYMNVQLVIAHISQTKLLQMLGLLDSIFKDTLMRR